VGLWLLGYGLPLALVLGGIATATAPAATIAVIKEVRARGRFTDLLSGIVALDDVFALLLFSALSAVAGVLLSAGGGATVAGDVALELLGFVGLGVALGVPTAYLSGRIKSGEATLLEVLGVVLVLTGITRWLGASPLIAGVVLGRVVANLAKHHERPIRALENVEEPVLVLFFLLTGASLDIVALRNVGAIGAAYVALRVAGKASGTFAGCTLAQVDGPTRRWLGTALLPHAGVALGLALEASDRFPVLAGTLLTVKVTATVLFELTGPILTRIALRRVGESTIDTARPPVA
jgi:Kef-type K+ transport system membrane component KefB